MTSRSPLTESYARRRMLRAGAASALASLTALATGCAGPLSGKALGAVRGTYPEAVQGVITGWAQLESASGGRLGVSVIDQNSGLQYGYRDDERFAFCSTFKVLAASAVLQMSVLEPALLQRRLDYSAADMVAYSPITSKHINNGMTVGELCAAALQYSDNTAANLLIRFLGGPRAVTEYARAIGDQEFRLDRTEIELNTAIPGDLRDTTTPAAMARDLKRLVLDDGLALSQRLLLQSWMRGNTTGNERIRAGVPADWSVADKTGSGDYGATNDVAVLWPTSGKPVVLSVYFVQTVKDAAPRSDVVAQATRIAVFGLTS